MVRLSLDSLLVGCVDLDAPSGFGMGTSHASRQRVGQGRWMPLVTLWSTTDLEDEQCLAMEGQLASKHSSIALRVNHRVHVEFHFS